MAFTVVTQFIIKGPVLCSFVFDKRIKEIIDITSHVNSLRMLMKVSW